MSIPVVLIAAVAENGVIGARGGLPWRVRADLKRFRALTMGKPLVMGRKTFESIGRVLDGRDTIVVTSSMRSAPEGVLLAPGIDEALALAGERARAVGASEVCVVGGAGIFAAAMPRTERLHVTHIAATPAGDVHFPKISPEEWREVSRENLPFHEGDSARACYVVYERRR
jgi:dihydrofolate reductase